MIKMAACSPAMFLVQCVLLAASFSVTLACSRITTSPPQQSSPPQPTTSVRTCSVDANGTLTMFNQETAIVAVPCKYRLADFTCGDYSVKVTPGNAMRDNGLYYPAQVWVKIVHMAMGDTLKIRTSLDVIDKYEEGKLNIPWKSKEGSEQLVDFVGISDGVAGLEKGGVFRVELGRDGVKISCSVDFFSSAGLPETLCGDGQTVNELDTARKVVLREGTYVTLGKFLHYVIMSDDTVTQSKACEDLTARFQACDEKGRAINSCEKIFGNPDVATCMPQLNLTTFEGYGHCLTYACDGDYSAYKHIAGCTL